MKKYSRIFIIVNLVLLLVYFNWSVYQKERTLKNGQLVLFELAPVDPRSLMQGDYMQLNYQQSASELINAQTATRGYAVLSTDSNHIARIIRLQESLQPVNKGKEFIIKYKIIRSRLFLGAESFFFEEGQDTLFQKAKYGGLKVDDEGQSLLIGLYDENLRLLQADK